VGNEREALALEHNLIKQYRPKFNVVLRDDKTYPYIKSRRRKNILAYISRGASRKTGQSILVRTFPASLARRILHFVHKRFLVPSCTVDLTRSHRGLACSTTSRDVWGLRKPVDDGRRYAEPRAMCGCFWKGAGAI